jgi:hypothetical protein
MSKYTEIAPNIFVESDKDEEIYIMRVKKGSPPPDVAKYIDRVCYNVRLEQIENLKCCGNCKKYIQNEGCCQGVWRAKDKDAFTDVLMHWVNDVCSSWEFDGMEAKDRRAE